MKKARKDDPANVIILLGETGAGKSSFLEYLTGTSHHSDEDTNSVTKRFQIEKTNIKGNEYYIMDTPGFDFGAESEVFHEIVKGIKALGPYARIVGVLLLLPMHHTRVNAMDEKLLRFARAFGGDEYMNQVVVVTNFWDAQSEDKKRKYGIRLANILEKVKELWSVQGIINHYQHGRKYQDGQDKGVFLQWDEDRKDIVEYAKDMIHRHYGVTGLRDPQIVRELRQDFLLEHTAAGKSLDFTRTQTPNSIPKLSSPYSVASESGENIAEEPKQNTSKQGESKQNFPNQGPFTKEPTEKEPSKTDPPQSPSSSDGVTGQKTGAQNGKGLWAYGLDMLGAFVSNIRFEVSVGPSQGFSNVEMGSHYGGPMDLNSVVDVCKMKGLDSSAAGRKQLGDQYGIPGTPGTASYNDALRRALWKLP